MGLLAISPLNLKFLRLDYQTDNTSLLFDNRSQNENYLFGVCERFETAYDAMIGLDKINKLFVLLIWIVNIKCIYVLYGSYLFFH